MSDYSIPLVYCSMDRDKLNKIGAAQRFHQRNTRVVITVFIFVYVYHGEKLNNELQLSLCVFTFVLFLLCIFVCVVGRCVIVLCCCVLRCLVLHYIM